MCYKVYACTFVFRFRENKMERGRGEEKRGESSKTTTKATRRRRRRWLRRRKLHEPKMSKEVG